MKRVWRALRGELEGLKPLVHGLGFLTAALPVRGAQGLRTALYRAAGARIGAGSQLCGGLKLDGATRDLLRNLTLGRDCWVDLGCTFELGERITLGDRVTVGAGVLAITTSHELGPREHRCGPIQRAPIVIEDGAWIGARAIVLPGVTIGAGAVVEPGAVVNKSVPPHARVAGIPARVVEQLPQA